jgi:hypothetical protein
VVHRGPSTVQRNPLTIDVPGPLSPQARRRTRLRWTVNGDR